MKVLLCQVHSNKEQQANEREAMQGTLEAVHALLLYRIRMTDNRSRPATSQRSLAIFG